MNKVATWFLNNLKWIFAVVAVGVIAGVAANNVLSSYNDYKAYEVAYEENDLEVRSNAAAAPKSIEIADDFKSKYAKEMIMAADELAVTTTQTEYLVEDYIDLTEKGGTIALALSLEEKSFLDIDFVVSSTKETTKNEETFYGVEDLLTNVDFIINGETMEEDIDLENTGTEPEWHHLVMSGFALPAGNVTITIKSKNGKASSMPQVQSINLFSSQTLSLAAE